jgi:hypothetical protein
MGALRLYALNFRDQIAATLYGFSHGGRAFYYLCGFDPEIADLSPGTLMIGHAIEQAIHEGMAEFDFFARAGGIQIHVGRKRSAELSAAVPAVETTSGPCIVDISHGQGADQRTRHLNGSKRVKLSRLWGQVEPAKRP